MQTLETMLHRCLDGLPDTLIGTAGRARLLAGAAQLPSLFSFGTIGLECPLHLPSGAADLLVCAQQRRNGALALRCSPCPPDTGSDPAWQSVRALGRLMGTLDVPAFDDVWLEFDVNGPAPTTPNLFCSPVSSSPSAHDLLAQLAILAPLVTGAALSAELSGSLGACLRALPAHARVFQVGAMRARPGAGLRLCIDQMSCAGILDLLTAIAYPGDIDAVRACLVRLQPVTGSIALNIDLTPQLQPKIGLECYAPAPLLRRFMDQLCALSAVTDVKCAALLAPCITTQLQAPAAPFVASMACLAMLASHRRCVFRRSLHHVKLVVQPHRPPEAKAYVAIRQYWAQATP